MTPLATLLWVLNITFDALGQLAFKAAAITPDHLDGLARWKHMLSDKWLWAGISAYVVETFCWIAFLSMVPLSMAVLLGSINILAVMAGGRIFFGEHLTRRRLAATALIAIGVCLVGWS